MALLESDRNTVFHCYNLVTLLPGLVVGVFRRAVVYDAAEQQTELPVLQRRPCRRLGIVAAERLLCRLTSLNIQADPLRADFFAQLHGVPHPMIINNTSDFILDPRTDPKPNLLRTSLGLDSGKILLYVGGIRPQFYLDTVVESLLELPDWHLVLLGHEIEPGYVDELMRLGRALGVEARLHWHPGVINSEVPRLVAGADLTVALMKGEGRSYEYCVPTKVFTSLAVGVPVIATHLEGLDRLYGQFPIGPQLREVTCKTVAAAVHDGEDKYQFFVEQCSNATHEYQWTADEDRLLRAYASLLA
jgi:glycosyltransferase involved in cell wall biosynthesis